MNEHTTVPEGFMADAKGRFVPVEIIDEIDLTRNDLVGELIGKAKAIQEQLHDFKFAVLGDIGAFVDLAGEKYDVSLGGKKGNVTLISYDGRFKIQRAIQESITFDERLQAAKALIDNCINSWTEDAPSELKIIVDDAFQVDKEGNVSTTAVLRLRRHKIDKPEWLKAMKAIADSIQITGSKTHVRFYERVEDDQKWQSVSLDISKL